MNEAELLRRRGSSVGVVVSMGIGLGDKMTRYGVKNRKAHTDGQWGFWCQGPGTIR